MDAKYVEENLKRISEYIFIDSNLFWEMEAGEHQNDIEFLLSVIYEQNKREEIWKKLSKIDRTLIRNIYDFLASKLVEAKNERIEVENEIDQL